MKLSAASTAIVRNARLAAVGGVVAIFVSLSVSACSGGNPPSGSPTFSPGGTGTPTSTETSTSTETPTATPTETKTQEESPSPSPSLAPSPTPSSTPIATPSPVVTVAPATGGGGTAGFQDALLLTVGAAAILVGAGSLAYRRRLIKNRQ